MSADVMNTILPIGLLLVLMACRMPIAFALGLSGITGIALQGGIGETISSLATIPYNTTAHFALVLVPLFILMGLLVSHSGMIDGIFTIAERITRNIPGGLGVAAILASTFLGAVSGSSVANVATVGRVAIGEMSRRGYDRAFAAALVASVGTIAILIPPSIALVLYGILTSESIGRLLLAGIIPGLITVIAYSVVVMILSRRYVNRDQPMPAVTTTAPAAGFTGAGSVDADPAPPSPRQAATSDVQGVTGAQATDKPEAGDLVTAAPSSSDTAPSTANIIFGAFSGLALFTIVVGGLYSGVFTSTEAGAIGAFSALVLTMVYVPTRRGRTKGALRRTVVSAMAETGAMSSMLFALLVGSGLFSHYLVVSGITGNVTSWVSSLDVSPHVVLVILLIAMIPLGMVMDGMSMLLIVTPLVYPIISDFGFDGVWFGILLIKMIEIGLVTPPVGLNVFVIAGMLPSLRVEHVFRRIMPFVVTEVVVVAILVAFPDLVTFLPDLGSVTE